MNHPIRNIIVGAAAAALPVGFSAPAGAAVAHPKFIHAIDKTAPGLKKFSAKSLTRLGVGICDDLEGGTSVSDELTNLVAVVVSGKTELSAFQVGVVIGGAVYILCPRPGFISQVNAIANTATS